MCRCIDNVHTEATLNLQAKLTKGLKMIKVEIELDATGFEQLWDNSMAWKGTDWAAQDGRFEPMPNYSDTWAYFFEGYLNAVVALGFIKATGESATLHSDETGGWLIVTNYASPCHL